MSVRQNLPGEGLLHALRNRAVRTGIYCGVCLSLVFAGWVVAANRFAFLDHLALERNLAAAGLLVLIAMIPVLRFLRSPGDLLASGLIAWTILSLAYRALSLYFSKLDASYSAFHIFMLGAVAYLLAATLCWLGLCIWRIRGSHSAGSGNHAG